jgi:predicted regulator of Ras-like GTPase activity (Roadblock/LC7/MglB family)
MPIEYRSDLLLRHLAALQRAVPTLRGAALLTAEGLVIAAYPPDWDADIHDPTGEAHVAALAAVMAGHAEQALARLNQGALEQVIVTGERGTLAILSVTPDASLALLLDHAAPLGLALHAARQAAQALRTTLDQPA